MSGLTVRKEFMTKFVGLEKHSRAIALGIVGTYVGLIVASIVAGSLLLQQPVGWANGAIIATLMLFIGTRMRGLNNIVHECTHASFTKERQDNVLIGSICASLVMGCYKDYRDEHMTHHAHLGDYEKDMDLQGIEDLRLHERLSWLTILRHVATPFVGMHLPYYLGVNMSARDGRVFQVFKIALIAAAVLFLVLEPVAALLMLWVPFVWIYSSINYWTDCLDHGGILEEHDELDASRNILAPAPIKYLFFPRNDCYHLVHHLFPQVPARHFHAAHEQLLAHPEYVARMRATTTPESLPAAKEA